MEVTKAGGVGSGKGDPRRAELVVPFVPPHVASADAPFDYWSILSMICGAVAVGLRVRQRV